MSKDLFKKYCIGCKNTIWHTKSKDDKYSQCQRCLWSEQYYIEEKEREEQAKLHKPMFEDFTYSAGDPYW